LLVLIAAVVVVIVVSDLTSGGCPTRAASCKTVRSKPEPAFSGFCVVGRVANTSLPHAGFGFGGDIGTLQEPGDIEVAVLVEFVGKLGFDGHSSTVLLSNTLIGNGTGKGRVHPHELFPINNGTLARAGNMQIRKMQSLRECHTLIMSQQVSPVVTAASAQLGSTLAKQKNSMDQAGLAVKRFFKVNSKGQAAVACSRSSA
jgi:hypothetical protein